MAEAAAVFEGTKLLVQALPKRREGHGYCMCASK